MSWLFLPLPLLVFCFEQKMLWRVEGRQTDAVTPYAPLNPKSISGSAASNQWQQCTSEESTWTAYFLKRHRHVWSATRFVANK